VRLEVKLQAAKEVAQYLEPKLRAVEVSSDPDRPLRVEQMTNEQLDAQIAALAAKYQALHPEMAQERSRATEVPSGSNGHEG
jgi:cytochrome c553